MTYRVTVTDQAEQDTRDNHAWWAENRSPTEAARWFVGINQAIQTLKTPQPPRLRRRAGVA